MHKYIKTTPRPFKTLPELQAWLAEQGLKIADLDGIEPKKFYEYTLKWLGCIVLHAPRTTKLQENGELIIVKGEPKVVRFWNSMALVFPIDGIGQDEDILIEAA